MADRGQHSGAVIDEAADAPLHLVEGFGRLANLGRARFLHRRRVHVGAEPRGSGRERPERRRHPARDQDRQSRETERHDPDPADERDQARRPVHSIADRDDEPAPVRQPNARADRPVRARVTRGDVDLDRRQAACLERVSQLSLDPARLPAALAQWPKTLIRCPAEPVVIGRRRLERGRAHLRRQPIDQAATLAMLSKVMRLPGGPSPRAMLSHHTMAPAHSTASTPGDQGQRRASGDTAGPQPHHARTTSEVKM